MKTFVVLLAVFLSVAGRVAAQDLTSVDLYLQDIDGDEHSFQDYLADIRDGSDRGAVFISFWAMWCEPCKQEMKALKPVYAKYKDQNFHYLAINLDNPRSLAKVKAYVKAQKLPYDFWLDPNSEVFKKLNGQSMPYSLLINQDGELVAKRTGYIAGDEHEIEDDIKKILEQE